MMKTTHRLLLVTALLGSTIGCDQATKQLATRTLAASAPRSYLFDTFRLAYMENDGAFLSLGAALPGPVRHWLFVVAVGAILFAMLGYAFFSRRLGTMEVAGYAVVAAGGLGNWIDRVFRDGSVVDFMNLGIGWLRTGVFNVADVAIFVGIGLLMLARRRPREAS